MKNLIIFIVTLAIISSIIFFGTMLFLKKTLPTMEPTDFSPENKPTSSSGKG